MVCVASCTRVRNHHARTNWTLHFLDLFLIFYLNFFGILGRFLLLHFFLVLLSALVSHDTLLVLKFVKMWRPGSTGRQSRTCHGSNRLERDCLQMGIARFAGVCNVEGHAAADIFNHSKGCRGTPETAPPQAARRHARRIGCFARAPRQPGIRLSRLHEPGDGRKRFQGCMASRATRSTSLMSMGLAT